MALNSIDSKKDQMVTADGQMLGRREAASGLARSILESLPFSKAIKAALRAPLRLAQRSRGSAGNVIRSVRRSFGGAAGGLSEYAVLAHGVLVHGMTGRTPPSAYQSMIRLFCYTQGRSNDLFSACVRLLRRPYALENRGGILSGVASPVDELKKSGYYVFPFTLPENVCDELLEIGLTEKCTRVDDSGRRVETRYERANPQAVKYVFSAETLINHPTIQKLVSDPSLVSLAQEYLGSQPILAYVNMWWITNINEAPDSEAAQLYHFDMDKMKFLKYFFYITDVGSENGPHCFIQRSHRSGGIPAALLQRGYARITDAEVGQHYPPDDLIEILGPRGTILAEDTRGLHKGKQLHKGDRLIFELEFANSLFGSEDVRPKLKTGHTTDFDAMLSRYPRLYSYFDIQGA